MPLASLFSLHWYGPAAAASITVSDAAVSAAVKGSARPTATIAGDASVPLAKPTRLRNSPATITGTGSVAQALPKARARAAATIRVSELTQDDVTSAVLEAQIAPGLTLKQALIETRRAARRAAAQTA